MGLRKLCLHICLHYTLAQMVAIMGCSLSNCLDFALACACPCLACAHYPTPDPAPAWRRHCTQDWLSATCTSAFT